MFLIPKLSKLQKSQEDISTIQDYLSQLPNFQAPYEILKELCKFIGYVFLEQGQQFNQNDTAYYILRGQLLADNGQTYTTDQWYDSHSAYYVVTDTHCMTLSEEEYIKFSKNHGSSYLHKKQKILYNLTSLEKASSPKLLEQLFQQFQEVQFPSAHYLTRTQESSSYAYILAQGKLQISREYQKKMTPYERQVLPKKFWVSEIQITELSDNGIIGEELLDYESALYNTKVVSKQAILYQIQIKQLLLFPSVVLSNLRKVFKDKHTQRDEIFAAKCSEMEKCWQGCNKQQILNQEIKKTINFKNIQKPKQDQEMQTQDISEFQRTKSPTKKVPTFIQQYFKEKHIDPTRKTNEISLEQFIQKQSQHANPYQLFEQVHDPLNYIQKGTNYKRQQFSIFVQQGIVKIKQPDMPIQPKRPYTNQSNCVDQLLGRSKVQSVHQPKPIVKSMRRFYRSQSANKTASGFSLLGKTLPPQNKATARDNMFFLRSNSSGILKLHLNKSQNSLGLPSGDKNRNISLFE